MILIVCPPCSLCLRVMGAVDEIDYLVGRQSDFWPNKYVCPKCNKNCRGVLELDADPQIYSYVNLIDLNPQEAFAAMHGMGLPSEGDCRRDVVEALLKEQPVRRITAKDIIGTNRCLLDCLELWDGTKVYFGAGSEGAVVYRIVRPTSYVEKIDGR